MIVSEYKVQKILFIKGVFIKDCIQIDDLFEKQLIEQLDKDEQIVKYEKLPTLFTDIDSWIRKTNIKCWNCDLTFDTQPIFIPKLIEPATTVSGYSVSVHGCFCSFACALKYNNITNTKLCDNLRVREMLKFLYKLFYNRNIETIYEAMNKTKMKQYGGDMELFEYKDLINELEKKMKNESIVIKK